MGTLLYETLTGCLPFTGSLLEVLAVKQASDPPRPDTLVPDLPADLVALSVALMSREAEARPTEHALLSAFRVSQPGVVVDLHGRQAEGTPPVGRARHLAALDGALAAAARGPAVSVCVFGPSGIRKTTLVRRFTDHVAAQERAIVLAGCCFVRETLPYKAFDGVIDMLSRWLRALPEATVREQLPADTAAPARVFPVPRRVAAIDRLAATAPGVSDQRELRRRAFGAFKHILATMARQRPMVVNIDDLQWADRDSADLLQDLSHAVAGFEECRSALWRAVAQRRKGELVGGAQGRALIEQADAWMAGEGGRRAHAHGRGAGAGIPTRSGRVTDRNQRPGRGAPSRTAGRFGDSYDDSAPGAPWARVAVLTSRYAPPASRSSAASRVASLR